jgi:murein DD-endopeptidase MepM/ murein hydrolase activator NlpD
MAAPTGTPVMATGAGRVLYAGFLQLTGNTC